MGGSIPACVGVPTACLPLVAHAHQTGPPAATPCSVPGSLCPPRPAFAGSVLCSEHSPFTPLPWASPAFRLDIMASETAFLSLHPGNRAFLLYAPTPPCSHPAPHPTPGTHAELPLSGWSTWDSVLGSAPSQLLTVRVKWLNNRKERRKGKR